LTIKFAPLETLSSFPNSSPLYGPFRLLPVVSDCQRSLRLYRRSKTPRILDFRYAWCPPPLRFGGLYSASRSFREGWWR